MLGELEKLETNLGGVADMKALPDAVFLVDLRKEQLAVREARRLNLPVIALVDTNCDPDDADFIIPGNDDAIRSCSLVVAAIADGIEAGKHEVTARGAGRRRRARRPPPRRPRTAAEAESSPPKAAPEAEAQAGRRAAAPRAAAEAAPADARGRRARRR